MSDAAWWTISLDPDERADADAARIKDVTGRPLVNPPGEDGRLGIDYASYLGLDILLDAQTPASTVPDERAFIAIHQLCEIAFKLMVFDLGVAAGTMERLLEMDADGFRSLATERMPGEAGPHPFWRPAMTAAGRLRHTARRVLPSLMPYVGMGEDDDVLFSSMEYSLFRGMLAPASGFQSAQLRLIQRALGKAPLFGIPVFPGDTLSHHYRGCPAGHIALTDELALRTNHTRAFPADDAPESIVARLDTLAHAVLARVEETVGAPSGPVPPVTPVHPEDVERVVVRFRTTLGRDADESPVARFRDALTSAMDAENRRREALAPARRGALALLSSGAPTCLSFVLDRLVDTDRALHGHEAWTFFTTHRRTVGRHVADDSGTGGGGMPYLVTSQRFLLPLVPALVAYADVSTTGDAGQDPDRW